METPQYVGSSAARMIAALTVFLGLVVVVVLMLTDKPGTIKQKIHKSKELANSAATGSTGDTQEAFFYDVVGRAPADFGPEAGEPEVKGPHPKVSFTLELKVATSKDEAEQFIDLLKEQGIEAYYTPLTRAGKVVYRVRRGIFTNEKVAVKAVTALKTQHNLDARVVKLQ